MRRVVVIACLAIAGGHPAPASSAAQPVPVRLTLERALQEAFERSPVLAAEKARVREAEGRVRTARTYPFNPEISVEAARRRAPGARSTDRELRVSQEVEIGGQRRRRVAEAQAELESARAALRRAERTLSANVRLAFTLTLRARDLRRIESANVALARSLVALERRRFEAGATNRIGVNLAETQVGRAERALALATAQYESALAEFVQTVGFPPGQAVEPMGELDPPALSLPPLHELIRLALQHRADVQAFQARILAAQERVRKIRREVVPNLVVEAFRSTEEVEDRLQGTAVSLRIPVFNRRRGAVQEAAALAARRSEEYRALETMVAREITGAAALYRSSTEAVRQLQEHVLGRFEESLRLLERAFETGKIGWSELVTFRREFVGAQREYVETLASAEIAAIQLELALGRDLLSSDKE